jgi:hypothetical protein
MTSPFAGVDWDQRAQKREVYRIVGKGHKGWSPNVDKELGNYDYLLGADVGSFVTTSIPIIDMPHRSTSGIPMSRKICTTGPIGFCGYFYFHIISRRSDPLMDGCPDHRRCGLPS